MSVVQLPGKYLISMFMNVYLIYAIPICFLNLLNIFNVYLKSMMLPFCREWKYLLRFDIEYICRIQISTQFRRYIRAKSPCLLTLRFLLYNMGFNI